MISRDRRLITGHHHHSLDIFSNIAYSINSKPNRGTHSLPPFVIDHRHNIAERTPCQHPLVLGPEHDNHWRTTSLTCHSYSPLQQRLATKTNKLFRLPQPFRST